MEAWPEPEKGIKSRSTSRHHSSFSTTTSIMYTIALMSTLFIAASAQYAAWPAQSYSPFYQALFSAAQNPVLAAPSVRGGVVPAAPAPAPVFAAPPPAPMFAAPAPAPVFAPSFAAPMVAPAPAFAPAFAPRPVFAAPALAPRPVFAAPAVPAFAPRVVPAYAPFARTAMFIGSNKNKST